MKKLSIVALSLLVAGAVSSWAQDTGSILFGPIPVTLTGTLNTKAKVTDSTLTAAAGGGTLEFAEVEITSGGQSGEVFDVLGTGIGTVNVGSTNVATNDLVGVIIYTSDDTVDLTTGKSKTLKLIGSYKESGSVFATNGVTSIKTNLDTVISNSVLLVTSTVADPKSNTNLNAKVSGIWFSGATAVSGTIKSGGAKSKK